jgi:diguanylate cyclase (GGDEF)-like protein
MPLSSDDHDLRIDSPWSFGERSALLLLIALVPSILVLDLVAGHGVSLHLFYIVPVALAAWNLGARASYAIAAVAGAAWAVVAVSTREANYSAAVLAWDLLSTLALFLFVAHLVARHRGLLDGLRARARLDGETGALSRREFDRHLEAETRRTRRYRRPLALVILDIGEVKGGGPGHLSAFVRSIQAQLRDCDSVARIGPRRFAVLLVECKAPEYMLVVERLRDALQANLRLHKHELAVAVASYGGSVPVSAASFMALAENHLNLARIGPGVADTRVD